MGEEAIGGEGGEGGGWLLWVYALLFLFYKISFFPSSQAGYQKHSQQHLGARQRPQG